ncbi:uncharacterized protein TNCV_2611551 [Trichonephila clavipes]|nr:uncharacterized protein TNCV_2611551 [Trichonephila clavipes]
MRFPVNSQDIEWCNVILVWCCSNWGCQRKNALVDHNFVRLEPQVQDYVEFRNPQNAVQLLEVLAKFEERYSCKAIRGSRNRDNVEERSWNEHRMSNVDNNRENWRNSEVVRRPSNRRNDYRGNYENGRQGNQWFESRNRFQKDDLRFNDKGYLFRSGIKPWLTHVLYHEIHTGDNPPVVSHPYRYGKVKQAILAYHVNKMLKEGTIIPI